MKVIMQMDDTGRHRLVSKGLVGDSVKYEFISSLVVNGRQFIGLSQYWLGVLPTEKPLEVSETIDGEFEIFDGEF